MVANPGDQRPNFARNQNDLWHLAQRVFLGHSTAAYLDQFFGIFVLPDWQAGPLWGILGAVFFHRNPDA
jgi:hypothetical protein